MCISFCAVTDSKSEVGGMSDTVGLMLENSPGHESPETGSGNSGGGGGGGGGGSSEEKPKDMLDPWENFDAHSAFLGPTLWDKRVPYDGNDFKVTIDSWKERNC